eukprot:CAMPEP_0178996306 /NCGR_PEP_ID=MMETSP0795-20121207/8301_1 /TAXON_ID=88552 /ORGANISM="Amoebophrya sp., Strain Ameob2" /LENGTH=161 /DNA_ID=CAMNT_0020688693 /DNA_START=47 /DNA_END=532 /DNA_ORIENTATION=-
MVEDSSKPPAPEIEKSDMTNPPQEKMAAGADEDKKKSSRRLISKEELAKHNTEEDCWVAIHGLVIDVNKELRNEHPGGPEVILALAGKDVTEDFEDIGHSDTAREWTDRLVIGYMSEEKEEANIPRTSELGGGAGGGGVGIGPLVILIIALVIGYFMFYQG